MFIKKGAERTVQEVVLRNTGMTMEEYLEPDRSPWLKNLDEAVSFFKQYVADHPNAPVTIVGDYDCDGVNAAAIMYHGIRAYMRKNPATRLPHRFSEGYGLSVKIIDEIDSGLVITVDNGIAAFDAVKAAKDKGLAVIITDHHLPPTDDYGRKILPPADVIFDPAAEEESEYQHYCGAALAYRFVEALLPGKVMRKMQVFAAIATVADVMPITGTNWALVKDGLSYLNERDCTAGLKALTDKLNLDNHIQPDDLGFKLGPCYNAAGRIYDNGAEQVLDLMKIVKDDPSLSAKAEELIQANQKRKELVKEALDRVPETIARPIVYVDKRLGEGIIGIIAGQLCEKEHCPAIVFTEAEQEGVLKGSGRSIPEINLKQALDKCKDHLLRYGGHAGAAGLSIRADQMEAFTQAFAVACGNIPPRPEHIYYDLELDERKLSEYMADLDKFAPFGEANPVPLFHTRLYLNPTCYNVVGDGTHFMVRTPEYTVCGFGMVDKYEKMGKPQNIEAVVKLSLSWFRGVPSYRMELVDFAPAAG